MSGYFIARTVAAFCSAASITCGNTGVRAEQLATRIEVSKNEIGGPPKDFEFARTGEGELGQWTVVRDPTATDGVAIEHLSTDQHDDRYPLAIYQPLNLENLSITARFKIISGTMRAAGIAFCLRNADNYYVVNASALEQRVDLLLVLNGKVEHIETADADVTIDHWHMLGVTVNDDHFAVSLDNKLLFTTFDRARMKDGRVALWTQEDNVTRFDRVEIRSLPSPEVR